MRKIIRFWLPSAIGWAISIGFAGDFSSGAKVLGDQPASPGVQEPIPKFDSPRLSRLAQDLANAGGKHDALDKFWKEMQGKTPLAERSAANEREMVVTFIWHGNKNTRRVGTLGTNPSPDPNEQELRRFLHTDLWYKTERMPSDARFGYALSENDQGYKPDPLNPITFAGRSVAELPDAPPEPWIKKDPSVPAGTVSKHKLRSELLDEQRSITVYLPANYDDKNEPYPLLVVFDGESYGSRPQSAIPTPTILDNLAAAKKMRPMVALLVDSQATRDRDLVCSDRFSNFLAKELIPWCRQKYHVSRDPSRVIVAGSSYGGLCAAYTAFRHSDVFGNVLAQSGTFSYYPNWQQRKPTDYFDETGWLTRQFAIEPKLPIRFYLSVGHFEGGYWSLLRENRHLRNVLEAKGYAVAYSEYSGGHDYVGWRNTLGEGLIALARLSTAKGPP
jgi:enterochelin esterase family protein